MAVEKLLLVCERESVAIRSLVGSVAKVVIGEMPTDGQLDEFAAIVLHGQNTEWLKNAIASIRSHPHTFLKPVLTLLDEKQQDIQETVDAKIRIPTTPQFVESAISNLLKTSNIVAGLVPVPTADESDIADLLILRYLYTRSCALNPVMDRSSRLGYKYEIIKTLLHGGNELDVLASLEERRLVSGTLIDKVSLCSFCQDFHLNFREVCPKCKSLEFREESTIHHFRCAYVGRESLFVQDEMLKCPKCRRELRHIGVDYDKPAESLWCEKCGTNFSTPRIDILCLNCGKNLLVENLITAEIKSYSLTGEGTSAAIEGVLPKIRLIDIFEKELGVYKREVFNQILDLEIRRCKRYKVAATLVKFRILNLRTISAKHGITTSAKLLKEFCLFLKSIFRTTDIITTEGQDGFLAILTHTSAENAKIPVGRILEKTKSLFTVEIEVEHSIVDLMSFDQEKK